MYRNGNGNCSLAELETYLMKRLLKEFPKEGKGLQMKQPGQDIWKAFRPCCKFFIFSSIHERGNSTNLLSIYTIPNNS
jgi:hypothetical protein